MKRQKHISIRISEETLRKFQFVAKYDDRSISGQIMYLIHKCIRDYEREHEEIIIEPDEE